MKIIILSLFLLPLTLNARDLGTFKAKGGIFNQSITFTSPGNNDNKTQTINRALTRINDHFTSRGCRGLNNSANPRAPYIAAKNTPFKAKGNGFFSQLREEYVQESTIELTIKMNCPATELSSITVQKFGIYLKGSGTGQKIWFKTSSPQNHKEYLDFSQ